MRFAAEQLDQAMDDSSKNGSHLDIAVLAHAIPAHAVGLFNHNAKVNL
jgi:hypothetical protein